MGAQLSKEERDRIARQYGASVPRDVSVTRCKIGDSATRIDYVWREGKGLVCVEDYMTIHRRTLEASWRAATKRRNGEAWMRRRRVADLHAQGLLNYEIANALGSSPSTIGDDVVALGLTPNRKVSKAAVTANNREFTISKIARLHGDGLNAGEIARSLGISVQRAASLAKLGGHRLRRAPKPAKTRSTVTRHDGGRNAIRRERALERAKEAFALRASGLGNYQIAQRMGVSHSTVRKWMLRFGGAE